jgi:hypothetical protein
MLDREKVRAILSNNDPSREPIYDAMTDDALMNEFDAIITRQIYHWLKLGWVGVKFTKTNGELRDLVCTLAQVHLPEREKNVNGEEADKKRKRSLDVVSVWDRDNEDWRSFRLDSVVEVWALSPIIGAK